jgi:type-F conjugative transfer system pilin assembly protein TrbC
VSSSTERLRRILTVTLLAAAPLLLLAAEDPATLAERARENAAKVTVDVTPARMEDVSRAKRVGEAAVERTRQEVARQAAERRARTEVAVTISEQGLQVKAPVDAAAQADNKPLLAGRLVVAISSSMPEQMVREYARQLDGVPEAILVLRGFVGGARTTKPTVEWIERSLRKNPGDMLGLHYRVEVVVDPLAFRMLGISQVPAVTFLPGAQDLRHCDAELLSTARVAYGAVSIGGALKALAPAVSVPAHLAKRFGGR